MGHPIPETQTTRLLRRRLGRSCLIGITLHSTDLSFYDPFFVLNGTPIQLTDDSGSQIQSGTFMFYVLAGDIFGFRIRTIDNIFGRATVTISNFEAPAPAVPEPSNILGLITISALGVGTLLKRR